MQSEFDVVVKELPLGIVSIRVILNQVFPNLSFHLILIFGSRIKSLVSMYDLRSGKNFKKCGIKPVSRRIVILDNQPSFMLASCDDPSKLMFRNFSPNSMLFS